MENKIEKVLFTEEDIQKKVSEIAKKISEDYKGKKVLMLCILKGSVIFFSDLVRNLDIDCTFDFMVVSSYGNLTSSTGQVMILKDLSYSIEDMDVIIVEDILDTGNTLSYLKKILLQRNPASLKICTFLDKPSRRTQNLEADYSGYTIPDEFVVGYGMDYAELYRNLPFVGVLSPSVYSKKD
ncbi:MAG: hypoxanthine phosphoribosyltransferase [Clostridia bacterium]|nr:hypoxanthine phosphoribosyltransferase [Clostridia bacterium]